MRSRRPLALLSSSLAAAATLLGFEPAAHAYYPFPSYMETHLGIASLPANTSGGCELCHNNPAGGIGTATQPFGVLIKGEGILFSSTEAQLDAALDAIKANPATAGYITDIEKGVDPNSDATLTSSASASSDTPLSPEYGCVASVAPGKPGEGEQAMARWLLPTLAALVFARSRRRHTADRP